MKEMRWGFREREEGGWRKERDEKKREETQTLFKSKLLV